MISGPRPYASLGALLIGFMIGAAAGSYQRPSVDACELAKADTLAGNTLLPLTIANACAAVGIRLEIVD